MGIGAWLLLLVISAALATAAQYLFFRNARGPHDFDWVYIAAGALLGGFTASVWYPVGPTFDGLYVLPAIAGAIVLGAAAGAIYRFFIRPRQTAR
ncbi:MAG TPA: hypothetical protein VFU88_19055 [Ktedonobacterales bacterium]|nr:hypothetical protein [Ktedonobacterales bacterium]